MKHVASLGVDGLRHYGRTLNDTGLGDTTVPMSYVQDLFSGFETKSYVHTVVNGDEAEVTYEIQKSEEDGNVYAKPDTEDKARATWHAIVNDENIEASTKAEDNSYIKLAKGSWLQVGNKILRFEKDSETITLDNFNDLEL